MKSSKMRDMLYIVKILDSWICKHTSCLYDARMHAKMRKMHCDSSIRASPSIRCGRYTVKSEGWSKSLPMCQCRRLISRKLILVPWAESLFLFHGSKAYSCSISRKLNLFHGPKAYSCSMSRKLFLFLEPKTYSCSISRKFILVSWSKDYTSSMSRKLIHVPWAERLFLFHEQKD